MKMNILSFEIEMIYYPCIQWVEFLFGFLFILAKYLSLNCDLLQYKQTSNFRSLINILLHFMRKNNKKISLVATC